ncbi:MAG: response regulator transcription factor [Acutalibacteraceae bacterium]
MYKVLFADDEEKLRSAVCDYFSAKNVSLITAKDGAEAVELVENERFDLIILDVMMPKKNGIEACREIREFSDVPVIFLSALGQERDLLKGYGAGADDYITKPFPLSVLYEKCVAVMRRQCGYSKEDRLTLCGVTVDKNEMSVFVGDSKIELSQKDTQLLEYLMTNRNIALSRDMILSRVWGYDFEGDDRVVDTHIKIIRKALGEKAKCIKTIKGCGYKFEEAEK